MAHKVITVPRLHEAGLATRQRLDDWAAAIDHAICAAGAPVLIVAHGFGCLAAIECYFSKNPAILGMLLVEPLDPAAFGLEPQPLSFPSIVTAARGSPGMAMARKLGSRFVEAGLAGEKELLAMLAARVEANQRELRVALGLAA